MKLAAELQPDQQPGRWDNHVAVYEAVFERLTDAFARRAIDRLGLKSGHHLIDVAAGSGGAALIAAARGAHVLAVDASPRMVSRICDRAAASDAAGAVRAAVMDGTALALPAARFDAALSIFGIVLFPDAEVGMREIARVLKPGGRAAVVTWTEPERYELVARLLKAIAEVIGPQPPPATLPAQLRFREESAFRALLAQGGLRVEEVVRLQEHWRLPSARWIAEHIAFAPGMAAMVGSLGDKRAAVLDRFAARLEQDQGRGEVALSAVAYLGIAAKAAG
jgi:SAM-dependent methyltransferase